MIKHLKPGIYAHYRHTSDKPMLYELAEENVVCHSEELPDGSVQEMVCYRALYKNPISQLWVRPRKMFEEMVKVNGKMVPRFRYWGETPAALPLVVPTQERENP